MPPRSQAGLLRTLRQPEGRCRLIIRPTGPMAACDPKPAMSIWAFSHKPQRSGWLQRQASQMKLSGTLRTWNDDRGFGFIAPTHGGAELCVHISASPRDGTRPTVGEKLSYELGRGKDGKPQAINVIREAIGIAPRQQPVYAPTRSRHTSVGPKIMGALLVQAIGVGSNVDIGGDTRGYRT